jgi:hypothetical protein
MFEVNKEIKFATKVGKGGVATKLELSTPSGIPHFPKPSFCFSPR